MIPLATSLTTFWRRHMPLLAAALSLACAAGCGTTINRQATEQLLTSDAVDISIARLPFEDLAGRSVYLDSTYIQPIKGSGFVNSDYIISSLRERITLAGCLLQEKREDADIVIEARVGALATQVHEVTYGIPASNALSSAASLVATAPPIPAIPEISLAKRNNQMAAAKVGAFAYDRETRALVWSSGLSQAASTANDYYVLGAGPFQRGTIYDGTQFAGSRLAIPKPDVDIRPDHVAEAPSLEGGGVSEADAEQSPSLITRLWPILPAGFSTPVESEEPSPAEGSSDAE